jgi:hypothetical protein
MHDAETLIAAIHRDWREAQGNYDEFRFFTGLRPSEEIALVLNDLTRVLIGANLYGGPQDTQYGLLGPASGALVEIRHSL